MSRPATAPSDRTRSGVFTLRGLQMTRIETFTDAAFAFALTLLVISLEPPTSADGLKEALREVPAFLTSGALLMMFWWGHHEWSRRYGLDDGPTVVLSCLLVFTVLVYVVPLRFMFGLFFVWIGYLTGLPIGSTRITFGGPEDVNTMFAVYGLGFMAMAGALVLLYLHAWRHREALALAPAEAFETRSEAGLWAIVAGTGGLSALLALVTGPSMVGVPGWAYMLLPVLVPSYAVTMNRRRERRFGEGADETPVGRVLAFVDRIHRADADGLADLMSDDHRLEVFEEAPVVGREACREAWRRYLGAFPRYRIRAHRVVPDDRGVAILGHTAGSHLGLPDAEEATILLIWRAEVQDGRITRWRVLDDTPERRRAWGLER